MAAYDIQRHFKGLRVAGGRRNSRPDPFATGFEDEIGEEKSRPSRSKTQSRAAPTSGPSATNKAKGAAVKRQGSDKTSRPGYNAFRDSDDDFLDPPARTDRRPSPAPANLPATRVTDGAGRRGSVDQRLQQQTRPVRSAVQQAAGTLAYLDDSEDEEELPRRPSVHTRYRSPAPRDRTSPSDTVRQSSPSKGNPRDSSQTRVAQPSRHTVASPFAGTKYLEDSSDSDEEAVTSRTNSTDDTSYSEATSGPESPQKFEVKPTDKPRTQNGGGVSWRAFSAGRAEQRTNEIEALQASFRRRGRTISFCPHAVTDDGDRVPIAPASETSCASASAAAARRGSTGSRGKPRPRSPPRRSSDSRPDDDEVDDGPSVGIYDPREYKTNPFSERGANHLASARAGSFGASQIASPSIFTNASPQTSDQDPVSPDSPTDRNGMSDSIHSITSTTVVSPPQTIPEGQYVEHETSPLGSPKDGGDSLSRNASVRSLFMSTSRPMRIPPSRRSSRRSTSATTSISPAHAFLSSWSNSDARANEAVSEPQPDDEGQAIGVNNEYIIGRQINRGGFGVVKEVHTIDENTGRNLVRAVKIVRKSIAGRSDVENDKCQQELDHEISVWRHLKHRHILDLIAVYDTDFATFCVMELNVGGTLFDLVRRSRAAASAEAKAQGLNTSASSTSISASTSASNSSTSPTRPIRKGLAPALARAYARQLASALRYLHEDIKVCHRDVKLENCLIDLSNVDPHTGAGNLRLCDFGLADFLHSASEDEDYRRDLEGGNDDGDVDTIAGEAATPATLLPTSASVASIESLSLSRAERATSLSTSASSTGLVLDQQTGRQRSISQVQPQQQQQQLSQSQQQPQRPRSRLETSVIGTLEYASPKGLSVHRKLYETAGDVWALGVIVFAVCTGDLPFKHPMPAKTVELILGGAWDETALGLTAENTAGIAADGGLDVGAVGSSTTPYQKDDSTGAGGPVGGNASQGSENNANSSSALLELLRGCLERDVDLRWTIGDVISCAWFDGLQTVDDEEDGADARRSDSVGFDRRREVWR